MSSRATFWLTVVSVNWGRKYRDPDEFKRNVQRVMRFTDKAEHVVILPQELDEEPDVAREHARFASMLEPRTRKVYWRSREPIVLSPSFDVVRRDRVIVMGSGLDIGGPRGTGPARPLTMCAARYRGITLGFGNWHPHRSGLHPKVDEARERGADKASAALTRVRGWYGGISGAYGTDYNSSRMPRMVPGERVGHHKGLDHLRYWQHPNGARMELMDHGSLEGTIDPHDPIWARFRVSG